MRLLVWLAILFLAILEMKNLFSTFSCIFMILCIIQSQPAIGEDEEVQEELGVFMGILVNISDQGTREAIKLGLTQIIKRLIKAEKKAGAKAGEISGLRVYITNYVQMIVEVSCSKTLSHRFDTFGMDFHLFQGEMLRNTPKLQKAMSRLKNYLTDRLVKMRSVTTDLKDLYNEYTTYGWLGDRDLWARSVKHTFSTIKNLSIVSLEINDEESTLKKLLFEFYNAKNKKDAVTVFQTQCANCCWSEIDSFEDHKEFMELAMDFPEKEIQSVILGDEKTPLAADLYQFVKDLYKTRKMKVSNRDRYEECAEVFYFAPDPYKQGMTKMLEDQWKDMEFVDRVHRFCAAFTALYNRISLADIHKDTGITEKNCQPNSTHFIDYIDSLHPQPEVLDDYKFVCKLLGAIN